MRTIKEDKNVNHKEEVGDHETRINLYTLKITIHFRFLN